MFETLALAPRERPEVSAGEAALTGGELTRLATAQPPPTADASPRSAALECASLLAHVRREPQILFSRKSAAFAASKAGSGPLPASRWPSSASRARRRGSGSSRP